MRVRTQADGVHLVGALVVDPRLDQVGREDVADREEVVVALQVVQHRVERGGHLVDVGHLVPAGFAIGKADAGFRQRFCTGVGGHDNDDVAEVGLSFPSQNCLMG